jgi:RNA polymerase sigma factor (sigma-70 family)
LRCDAASPAARDLADTLFADLYGLGEAPGRRSLFRYFHGRSSLKTWLRAVLAQRHIDSLRLSRRFAELPEEQDLAALHSPAAAPARVTHPEDPHRERYLRLFHHALESALAGLEPRDRQRLRMYYAEEKTLADIGRELREHESSVSRNLERVRRELRQQVELALRKGQEKADGTTNALSEAEVALCLEYAAEDAPIDLDTMFPTRAAPAAAKERKP